MRKTVLSCAVLLLCALPLAAQSRPRTATEAVRGTFQSVNRKVLEMAKDFPADKYDFKLKPEMRSFGEVMVHLVSGNAYAAKIGRGEKANWDEIDAKDYQSKDQVVALMEKTIADSEASLKAISDTKLAQSAQPWLSVTEHNAEHYGLLVAYYRANGLVPPETRRGAQ
ncbi:MAG TPA: DinB family protein [Terriglobales bacterium]|nr:DinB family protein [Terriglobales bacterium]